MRMFSLLVLVAGQASATTWYVRPLVYSGVEEPWPAKPIPVAATYGSQDGTSYGAAWNGLTSVVWGAGGVLPGDTLYVCDDHHYNITDENYYAWQGMAFIGVSGSNGSPITIRGDYAGHSGRLFGNATGLHTNGYGFRFSLVERALPQTTNNSYVDFINLYFDNSAVLTHRTTNSLGGPHHIRFVGCTFTNWDRSVDEGTVTLYAGHNYWDIIGCTFSGGINGIYAEGVDGPIAYFNVISNVFGNIGVNIWSVGGEDCHGIGIQNLSNGVFTHNTITNTGSAIEFYNGSGIAMTNNEVAYNFIRDSHVVVGGTQGGGVTISGASPGVAHSRDGFSVHHNIIVNTGLGATQSYHGPGISSNAGDLVNVWNNTLVNCKNGIWFEVAGAPVQIDCRNNLLSGCQSNVFVSIGTGTGTFTVDYNLYYTNGTSQIFTISPDQSRDSHSLFADPLLTAAFQPSRTSPVINAGTSVGLTTDFLGNPIVGAPDIGAFEYFQSANVGTLNVGTLRGP